jgi:CheY-like chemotaxis protein
VLVAEDDPLVRGLLVNILWGDGYTVLEAADGPEAVRLGQEHAGPIDLLVSDVELPALRGPGVARVLQPLRPGMRVLLLSGYPLDALPPGVAFLEKPCTVATISEKVRELLAG